MKSRLEDRTIVEAVNSWASSLGVKENLHVEAGGNNFMQSVVRDRNVKCRSLWCFA